MSSERYNRLGTGEEAAASATAAGSAHSSASAAAPSKSRSKRKGNKAALAQPLLSSEASSDATAGAQSSASASPSPSASPQPSPQRSYGAVSPSMQGSGSTPVSAAGRSVNGDGAADTPISAAARNNNAESLASKSNGLAAHANGDADPSKGVAVVTHQPLDDEDAEPVYTHWGAKFLPGPGCVRNILGNELCERFGYYGLRAILVLYFREQLGWAKERSVSFFSYWVAIAYFMPLLGGYVSDSYWGKYKTILRFSFIYVIGAATLAASAIPEIDWVSIIGLVLIGVGTGGIKPCVSSFGADQFTSRAVTTHEQLQKREHEISSFFHFFYFSINLGSVGSFIATPLLRRYLGYPIAFGVPAVLLFIATVVFWSARKQYYRAPVGGSVLTEVGRVFSAAWKRRGQSPPVSVEGESAEDAHASADSAPRNWLDNALQDPTIHRGQVENAKAFWRVLPIFAVLPAFWMLFDQQSSSWILQADEMKLYGLEPEQLGVVNPVLIMILLPLFDKVVYPAVERCGIRFSPLRRMGVGMLIAVVAFVLSAGVQWQINQHDEGTISVFLQLPQILLISIAEILISVTGLEFAYTQATPALKSSITAVFLLTTAIGNLLTGVLYDAMSDRFGMVEMFLIFAALMLADFLVFVVVAVRYKPVVVVDQKVRGEADEEETEEERMIKAAAQGPLDPAADDKKGHLKRASTTSILLPDGDSERV